MEVTDGNDGALAAGATRPLFVSTPETSHVVGTNRPHKVLPVSTQEYGHLVHLTKRKRAGPRGGTEVVGLTRVCNQLNFCCDSHSSYSYNRPFPSWPRFPVTDRSCGHERDWHLIRLCLACYITVVFSVAWAMREYIRDINPSWTEIMYRACTCMEPRQ